MKSASVIWLITVVVNCAPAGAVLAPVVQTNFGPISGVSTATGVAYLGVPFAAPPLRWGPPTPPPTWNDTLVCNASGTACIQFVQPLAAVSSEDCLTLDVYVPTRRTAGSPLIFWIPGGGCVTGGAASGIFSSWSDGSGAVIVTANCE